MKVLAEMNIILVVLFYYFVFWAIRRAKKTGGSRQGSAQRGRTLSDSPAAGSGARPVSRSRVSDSRGSRARSTDGHVLTGERDVTCRKYGHRHSEDVEPRFLVHDDPGGEEYIILNGQRVRLKEADKYFCR